MGKSDRTKLFDDWAQSYDAGMKTIDGEFPFDGYERILDEVVLLANVKPGMKILDLGIGTGNLTARFLYQGCTVWGLDFSAEMIAQARTKMPRAMILQADLLSEWPSELQQRFDRIVSAYVFHEFHLKIKIKLLQRIAFRHLSAGGRILIADVAFPTRRIRAQAAQRWADQWDETETYWAADEAITACERVGLHAAYKQISRCGGVFLFSVKESKTWNDIRVQTTR